MTIKIVQLHKKNIK